MNKISFSTWLEAATDDLTVDGLLEVLRGQLVHFISPSGNNGDELIRMGCEAAFAAAGISLTDDPDKAVAIIQRGGGALVDYYTSGTEVLQRVCADHPETPFVVLPHSVMLEKTDIRPLIAQRRSPMLIFAREQMSYENLRHMQLPQGVRIALDHDMAFRLQGSEFISRWRERQQSHSLLVCERRDAERTAADPVTALPGGKLKSWIPAPVKIKIKHYFNAPRASRARLSTDFERQLMAVCLADHPEMVDLPIIRADISDRGVVSFDNFCQTIANSAAILTNRLHVGVFAALLGKPTYLQSGSYYKVQGIYEHSLRDWRHVHYVE